MADGGAGERYSRKSVRFRAVASLPHKKGVEAMMNKVGRWLVAAAIALFGLAGCANCQCAECRASSRCGEPPYGAIIGGILQGIGAGLSAL